MYLVASPLTGAEAVTIGVVLGVIIVLVLIVAFVLGARRKEREPSPELEPLPPNRDSWATPPATTGHAPHGDPNTAGHHS
jgi:LPXTG-motif cell wall-anchored protein